MNNAYRNASLIIPAVLILLGCALQLSFDSFPLQYFKFPVNLIVIIQLLGTIIALHLFLRDKKFVKFLYSGYAAISSISLFTLLVIIMVLTHQDGSGKGIISALGFDKVIETWLYAFSSLYMLITLGSATMKRLIPLNIRNVFFFISHFGLWIVIATGSLGQADKIKINLSVPEGELIW
ncbi:MAG: hypothetical protein PHE33_11755, partial [Bacteroidales bacterium]|nr:hypothetical protein [Bacteroidales bacterium]